jgi:hypothetical protein
MLPVESKFEPFILNCGNNRSRLLFDRFANRSAKRGSLSRMRDAVKFTFVHGSVTFWVENLRHGNEA